MMKTNNKTKVTSVRLSSQGESILEELSSKLGIAKTAIIELALRKYYEIESNGNGQTKKSN